MGVDGLSSGREGGVLGDGLEEGTKALFTLDGSAFGGYGRCVTESVEEFGVADGFG